MDSVVVFCAKYLFVAVVLLYLLALAQANPRQRKAYIAAIIITGVAAVILDKVAGKLYYDPRPFVSHHYKPLITHAADNGFPSEHTLFSMAVAATVYLYRRGVGTLAVLIALIVGIARVAVHVHSPIDIIGGALLGIAAAAAGYYLTKYLIRRRAAR